MNQKRFRSEWPWHVMFAIIWNIYADLWRKVTYVGPARKMYRSLARRIVDEQCMGMIPLFSGMQTPLVDAVIYLTEIGDIESLPRLERLFNRYTFNAETSSNPMCDVLDTVQRYTAEALITLLPKYEQEEFIAKLFLRGDVKYLSSWTTSYLVNHAISSKMNNLAPIFLKEAKRMQASFEYAVADLKARYTRSISFNDLYGYEDLAYGAWRLSSDPEEQETALTMLVEEYNHEDASKENWPYTRSHDHINIMMCRILYENLASYAKKEEQNALWARLDPKRLEDDTKFYMSMMSIPRFRAHVQA